ncbi:hypothetical protein BC629DRAFT_1663754 [Irpex lacteus]|nr:hypothetical protein BC629DRAFT_1663754 [Irpex lacteus]
MPVTELVHLLPEISELVFHLATHEPAFNMSHATQITIFNETDLTLEVSGLVYIGKTQHDFTYGGVDYNIPPKTISPHQSSFSMWVVGFFGTDIEGSMTYSGGGLGNLFTIKFKNPLVGSNVWDGTGETQVAKNNGYTLYRRGDGKGSDCHVTFVFKKN